MLSLPDLQTIAYENVRKVDTFYRLFRHVCVPLHAENPNIGIQ